jgi:hypothetical protein
MPAKKPEGNVALQFSYVTVSFDPDAFDVALRAHGVKLVHYRALQCPVGMIDRYDSRRVHEDHAGCSNGFLYRKAGTVTCLFTGNDNHRDQNDLGLLDGSTVQVTAPRTYDDSDEEVQIAVFDRLYLFEENVTVPHWQLVEAHVTGRDKLSFPVAKVTDLVDTHGKSYGVADYAVENGVVVWKGDRPGFDAEAGKGEVYSIRYLYRPFFYCARVLHQVRVAQVEDQLQRKAIRMPQSFVLQRENVFLKEEKDDRAPDPNSQRQVVSPRRGAYGPR